MPLIGRQTGLNVSNILVKKQRFIDLSVTLVVHGVLFSWPVEL